MISIENLSKLVNTFDAAHREFSLILLVPRFDNEVAAQIITLHESACKLNCILKHNIGGIIYTVNQTVLRRAYYYYGSSRKH